MTDAVIHPEVLFVSGYAVFLLLVLMALEWVGHLTHRGVKKSRTAGFTFQSHANSWRCSEGELLRLEEIDHQAQVARYRARPHVCNRCHCKHQCTDSDDGRELLHSLIEWPYSEVGRFQRVISLTLSIAAGLMLAIALARHHHDYREVIVLGMLLIVVYASIRHIVHDLRLIRPDSV